MIRPHAPQSLLGSPRVSPNRIRIKWRISTWIFPLSFPPDL